jgi:hypothetical protein
MCGSPAWQALGHRLAEWILCRAAQASGVWPRGTEIMHVCISCVAGLGGMYLQSRDLTGLCRLWGHGQQCRDCARMGAWPSETELLQGCAGLWGMVGGGDRAGL